MESRTRITALFIQLLGVVHVFNFYNLFEQSSRLLGVDGLIPVVEFIQQFNAPDIGLLDKLQSCPSFLLWFNSDFSILAGTIFGLVLSFFVVAGFQSRKSLILIFPLYLSYTAVGQELFSFQWDSLILETTFLAVLLPSSGWFFKNFKAGADKIATFLFLWLLFRIYIESGVAKLFWGPGSWSSLTAMSHYYETAPIPTFLGWKFHFMSDSWHQFETGMTMIVEILVSAFIFAGKWPRRVAFVVFTVFQVLILLTANYGIFNFTTLCIQLFLLTDEDLRLIPVLGRRIQGRLASVAIPVPKWWIYPWACVIFCFSIIEFMMFAGGRGVYETRLAEVQKFTQSFHIASRYHLFGPIDPIRYEMEVECKYDSTGWKTLEFPYNAGSVNRAPKMVAPYHPRLDFRLWFDRYPVRWEENQVPFPECRVTPEILPSYMSRLVIQLQDNALLANRHFLPHSFDTVIADSVRLKYYHYGMIDTLDADSNQLYWERVLVGIVYIDTAMIGKTPRVEFFVQEQMELTPVEAAERQAENQPTPNNYIDLGVTYYRAGNFEGCIWACFKAIELDPNNSMAYNNICTAYNRLGNFKEALKACNAALNINPDFELARNNRQVAANRLGIK